MARTSSEALGFVLASCHVIRHVRPKFSCRFYDTIYHPALKLDLPIRCRPSGAGLLAHVLLTMFCDHLRLYREPEIYACKSVEVERLTPAVWCGQSLAVLRPVVAKLERHILAAKRLHADDTPVAVLTWHREDQHWPTMSLPARRTVHAGTASSAVRYS